MKLTAKVKLLTDETQRAALLETMERVNQACDWVSEQAWKAQEFRQYSLHALVYPALREKFGLPSQIAARCIAKVADAYKLDKKTKRTFRIYGSIGYDSRILGWNVSSQTVSIRGLHKRLKIRFAAGDRQLAQLANQRGESDLIYQRGEFYLAATCDVAEPERVNPAAFLGVDLGVAEIASTSDGLRRSGAVVKGVRHRHRRLRRKLQKIGTPAAKRRLKLLSGKESRFARHVNHIISKQIVATAKGTDRGIAVEELTGIRNRVTVRKSQRAVLHSWAFAQLRAFLVYKAILAGVLLLAVDPRNTSRECSKCGHVDKRNRPNQSTFRCLACGHAEHADINAARVIASRAACKPAEDGNIRLSELCSSTHSVS